MRRKRKTIITGIAAVIVFTATAISTSGNEVTNRTEIQIKNSDSSNSSETTTTATTTATTTPTTTTSTTTTTTTSTSTTSTTTSTSTNPVTTTTTTTMPVTTTVTTTYYWDGPVLNSFAGIISGPSGNETYYNLDMSGVISMMQSLGYNYDYWVREDGVKMYGDYVMCAADLSIRPKGTIVDTSLGKGIVCDTGGFVNWDPTRLDIATTW